MTIDYQMLFNLFAGLVTVLGGWVLSHITKIMDRLDNDLRSFPATYVSKEDYRHDINDIKEMLNKIFDKMDNKVDK